MFDFVTLNGTSVGCQFLFHKSLTDFLRIILKGFFIVWDFSCVCTIKNFASLKKIIKPGSNTKEAT